MARECSVVSPPFFLIRQTCKVGADRLDALRPFASVAARRTERVTGTQIASTSVLDPSRIEFASASPRVRLPCDLAPWIVPSGFACVIRGISNDLVLSGRGSNEQSDTRLHHSANVVDYRIDD